MDGHMNKQGDIFQKMFGGYNKSAKVANWLKLNT